MFKTVEIIYKNKTLSEVPVDQRNEEVQRLIDEGIIPEDYGSGDIELFFKA
jgi:hypothetical protein